MSIQWNQQGICFQKYSYVWNNQLRNKWTEYKWMNEWMNEWMNKWIENLFKHKNNVYVTFENLVVNTQACFFIMLQVLGLG